MQSEEILPEKEASQNTDDNSSQCDSNSRIDAEGDLSQRTETESDDRFRQLEDKYLRLAAEFDNYKKRMAREFVRIMETSTDDYSRDLFEIVDDLERALGHSDAEAEILKEGMNLILTKLNELLKKRGIEQISTVGEMFDPSQHEAIMQIESDNAEDGIIVKEIQKGYRANGRVLRPARVAVAKRKENN